MVATVFECGDLIRFPSGCERGHGYVLSSQRARMVIGTIEIEGPIPACAELCPAPDFPRDVEKRIKSSLRAAGHRI